MNRYRLVFPRFKTTLAAMALCVVSAGAYAAEKGCWVDFFEDAQYAGKHFRVNGPAKLADLKKVDGENWDRRIHSLKVGPKAKVTVYQNPRFELPLPEMVKRPDLWQSLGVTEQDVREDAELIFIANSNIHDMGDFNFHKKIRSLKVECV
jgi:hypothetical protein